MKEKSEVKVGDNMDDDDGDDLFEDSLQLQTQVIT